MSKQPDTEMDQFMASLEGSLQEGLAGQGRVTTGEQIAKRTGGRPPLTERKQPVTLRMPPDTLAKWRASGKGWQTRAATVLAAHAPA